MSKLIHQLAQAKAKKTAAPAGAEELPSKISVGGRKGKLSSRRKDNAVTKQEAGPTKARKDKGDSCIIYLGHLPHGFFEQQIKKFFSQFGTVKRTKLFRSTKTGGSKGYAFVEFDTPETASLVSDAMNGYLIKDRQLIAHVIPTSQHHDGMFKIKQRINLSGDKKRKKSEAEGSDSDSDGSDGEGKNDGIKGAALLNGLDADKAQERIDGARERLNKKQKRLDDLGIDFEIPTF